MTIYYIKKDNQRIAIDTNNYIEGITRLIDAGFKITTTDYYGMYITVFKMDGYCFRHGIHGAAHCSTVYLAAMLFLFWANNIALNKALLDLEENSNQ